MPEDSNPDPTQFPLLAASLGIEGDTLHQVAELVTDRYEAWAQVGGMIETQRLTAKKAIADASTVAAVKAAYEAIQWP